MGFVQECDAAVETPGIADKAEINAFWTEIMRSDAQELKDRLKASELCARAAGMFTDKQEIRVVDSEWFKDA